MNNVFVFSILLLFFCYPLYGQQDGSQKKLRKIKKSPEAQKTENSQKTQDTREAQEAARDFRQTKFLQLDKLILIKEMNPLREEIRRNIVDTILSSKTHTPVFAKKRPEKQTSKESHESEASEADEATDADGYSNAYANFFSLLVTIENGENNLQITLEYQNWLSNNQDKEIRKDINKYNVLNEMRFAIYELLNGKDYVRDNYNRLQRSNYQRIQTIRKAMEIERDKQNKNKKKINPKKASLDLDDDIFEDDPEDIVRRKRRERTRLKNPNFDYSPFVAAVDIGNTKGYDEESDEDDEDEKNDRNKNEKISQKENQNMEDSSLEAKNKVTQVKRRYHNVNKTKIEASEDHPEDYTKVSEHKKRGTNEPGNPWPYKTKKYVFTTFFNEFSKAKSLVNSSTSLNYLGVGFNYERTYQMAIKNGVRLSGKIGLPIFKDDYDFPNSTAVNVYYHVDDILNLFRISLGVEYSTLFVVNIYEFGGGLQVLKNKTLWPEFMLSTGFQRGGLESKVEYVYSSSVNVSNNLSRNFKIIKHKLALWFGISDVVGIGLSGSLVRGEGDISIKAQNYEFLVGYIF